MEARKRSEDLRRNSRKQQRPQQDAMGKKYQLVDEESEVDIEEEQTHEDAAMVRVDAENELEAADDESDGIPSDVGELDEWTRLDLQLLHKDLMCPICLGILKNTKTFNDCLHRFCGSCVNQSMNVKKHCPSCRKSYGTNRVLRNDPNMDSIIEVVIGDIGKYDREVLNNNAEEVHQRQPVIVTEVLNDIGNTSTGRSVKRSSNGQENAHARKRTHRSRTLKRYANQNEIDHDPVIQNEHQQDQVNKNETNCNEGDEKKEDNEIMEEIIQLKSKKLKRFSQDSSTDTDIEYVERNISGGVVSNTETPSSGGAAARFHRSLSGARRIRNTRLTKLAKHLRLREQKKKKNDQFEIHVKLVSLNTNMVGNLEKPHLFCNPAMSFHHLREYIARETPLRAKDVQLFVVEEANPYPNRATTLRNHHSSLYREVGHSNVDVLLQEDSHILAHCPIKNGKLDVVSLAQPEDEPEAAAKKLTKTAFTHGSCDNITCIIVKPNHNLATKPECQNESKCKKQSQIEIKGEAQSKTENQE